MVRERTMLFLSSMDAHEYLDDLKKLCLIDTYSLKCRTIDGVLPPNIRWELKYTY